MAAKKAGETTSKQPLSAEQGSSEPTAKPDKSVTESVPPTKNDEAIDLVEHKTVTVERAPFGLTASNLQQERSKRSKSNHQVVSQVAVNCLNSQESRNVTISKSNHALVVMMSATSENERREATIGDYHRNPCSDEPLSS